MRTGALAALTACLLAGCTTTVPLRPPVGTVQHMVLIKWKDDTTPEKRQEMMNEFRLLQTRIPGIHSIDEGPDISTEKLQKGFNHGAIVTFEDRTRRDYYLTHPAHEAFKKKALPMIDELLVVDFEIEK
jgi:stress responsive alpha/beta barrel protein